MKKIITILLFGITLTTGVVLGACTPIGDVAKTVVESGIETIGSMIDNIFNDEDDEYTPSIIYTPSQTTQTPTQSTANNTPSQKTQQVNNQSATTKLNTQPSKTTASQSQEPTAPMTLPFEYTPTYSAPTYEKTLLQSAFESFIDKANNKTFSCEITKIGNETISYMAYYDKYATLFKVDDLEAVYYESDGFYTEYENNTCLVSSDKTKYGYNGKNLLLPQEFDFNDAVISDNVVTFVVDGITYIYAFDYKYELKNIAYSINYATYSISNITFDADMISYHNTEYVKRYIKS